MRALALALVLGAASAQAQASIENWGRVTVLGGYRWVPNWYFNEKARAAGYPLEKGSIGGPSVVVSFGYGATSVVELAVDGFFGWETFKLSGLDAFNSFVYGGGIGPRLVKELVHGVTGYVSVQGGPLFSDVQSNSLSANPERALGAFFVSGGFNFKVADKWAITLDVRWIYARGVVPEISGLNVGGVAVSLGITSLFPPPGKRELDIPGFTAPSNL